MKINTLHARNFMGLNGDHKWEFTDKIMALCAPVGTGKTSVISALRYAVCGTEPAEAELIHAGTQACAVQIDTPSGTYMRIKKKGRTQYRMDNKNASYAEFQQKLEKEAGISLNTAKLITSSELLRGLDSRQFGDLLLQYLPEMMDRDTVIGKVTGANSSMKKIMEDHLPDGEFGPCDLDSFFTYLTEERRKVKKEIAQQETLLRAYGEIPKSQETEAQLQERLKKLQARRDEAVVYEQKLQNYMGLKKAIERNQRALNEIEAEIAKVKEATRHPDGERKAVEELMMASRRSAQAALDAKRQDRAYHNTLKEAVETILQPVCPLSKSIRCTTDKTPVLEELKAAANQACENYKRHAKEMEEAKQKALETETRLKEIDADNAAADRRQQLEQERRRLLDSALSLPEKPEKGPDLAVLNNEIDGVQKALRNIGNQQKAAQAAKELEQKRSLLADVEHLHEAFSPKGEVKSGIMKEYLDAFSGPLNTKVKQIFPAMNISFVSDEGVTVLVDTGNGQSIPLSALSGGQKTILVFLIMLLFSELSSLRLIILDELSVLDAGAMDGLLTVLEKTKDQYDLALLACVNHDDSSELIRLHNVKELSLC